MATTKQEKIEIPTYLRFSKVIVWLMYFWVTIGVIALSLRVFLLLFSANTSAGFADFIMRLSSDYLQPFRGIFSGRNVGETGYLDVSSIFAIIIYLLVAWGFRALIDYIQGKIDISVQEQKDQIKKAERARAQATVQKQSVAPKK